MRTRFVAEALSTCLNRLFSVSSVLSVAKFLTTADSISVRFFKVIATEFTEFYENKVCSGGFVDLFKPSFLCVLCALCG